MSSGVAVIEHIDLTALFTVAHDVVRHRNDADAEIELGSSISASIIIAQQGNF